MYLVKNKTNFTDAILKRNIFSIQFITHFFCLVLQKTYDCSKTTDDETQLLNNITATLLCTASDLTRLWFKNENLGFILVNLYTI